MRPFEPKRSSASESPRSRASAFAVLAGLAVIVATPARVLIPCAAGVVAWRALVAERGIERLVVFGSTLGLGMFWIAFTLLARAMPPTAAAWLAAGSSAGAAALLARGARRPPEPTGPAAPPLSFELPVGWCLVVLLGALAIAASTYAAAGTLSTFSETVEHHVPLVASLQRGNWPPMDLREPPHALEYHWGLHALAAGLGLLAGSDAADLALFATNAGAAALAFALAFLLVSRYAGRVGGAFSAILLVGAGTLNWLSAPRLAAGGALAPLLDPMGFPFTTGNLIVGGFFWRMHTNSTSWAASTLLLAVELGTLAWQRRRVATAVAAAVALALVAPTNETLFCAAVAALSLTAILKAAVDRPLSWKPVLAGVGVALGAATLAPFLGGVLATFLSTGSASHQARVVLNREHFGAVSSWNFSGLFGDPPWIDILSLRFLQDAGPLPLLALPAGVLALRRRAWPIVAIAATSVVLLGASTTFTLTHYPANMFRLLSASVSLGGLAVGYALAIALRSLRPAANRRAATALAALATMVLVAAWPLSWVGLTARGRGLPWPRENGGPLTDASAVGWLRSHTSFKEAVLTLPPGRSDIEASGQVYPMGSFVGGRPEYAERALAALAGPDLGALQRLGIRYLYLSEADLAPAQRGIEQRAVNEGRAAVVWRDADRGRLLIKMTGE
jgi:hypothetical protein